MIRDVDETLSAWFSSVLPGVAVSFDPPGTPRPSKGSAVLHVHLADVREEDDLTTGGWASIRDDDGLVRGRVPSTRRYRFAYLLIAEASDVLTEHDLLGQVLAGTTLTSVIPDEHLTGALQLTEQVIVVRCAPEKRFSDPTHLWQAWGVAPRLALELTLLAAVPVAAMLEVAPPPEQIDLSTSRGVPHPPVVDQNGGRKPRARIEED